MAITATLFIILVFLDQLSKYLVELHINTTTTIIPYLVDFTKVYNTGAGWGALNEHTWILAVISLLASIFIGYYCFKNDWKRAKINSLGITLAFAGCFGNLIDRFMCVINPSMRKGVVDMIILKPLDNVYRAITGSGFPVFNLADAFLVVGLILFIIDIIFLQERRKKKYGN